MVRYEGLDDFLLHKSNLSEQELEKLENSHAWQGHLKQHPGAKLIPIGGFSFEEEEKLKRVMDEQLKRKVKESQEKIIHKQDEEEQIPKKRIVMGGCACGLLLRKEGTENVLAVTAPKIENNNYNVQFEQEDFQNIYGREINSGNITYSGINFNNDKIYK